MSRQTITEHEGSKYLNTVYSAYGDLACTIDVYSVLEGFKVTCPATAHAIKKLLCAGQRGKGTRLEDLKGAMSALNRAIDMQERREERQIDADVFKKGAVQHTQSPTTTKKSKS